MQNKIKEGFRTLFLLDLRSLSLLRIGVSLTVMIDLVLRFSDLRAHYTNSGVLPLEALFRYAWDSAHISVYTMAGSWPLQALLFAINFACACCLLLGYRTRLFTFICWFFLLSLHNRNPLVQQAGDDLLRLLLFWGLFLPWGCYYALDTAKTNPKPVKYYSLAGFAYVLQVFYVYFFSALLKSSPEWTSEYTALYYALSLDQIRMPFGSLIYPYENLLAGLTMLTFHMELLLPLILFLPFFNAYFRFAFVLIIGMFQAGIGLSLNVGLFPLISIVAMIGLLPGFAAEKIHRMLIRVTRRFSAPFKTTGLMAPSGPIVPRETPVKRVAVLFFIAYTLAWNLRTVQVPLQFQSLNWVGNFLRIDQFWSMFAPSVFKDDGWFVLKAQTTDNESIDISQEGEAVNFDRPSYIAGLYKNDRWRKYSENILFVSKSHYRLYYCRYLMRQWNKEHDKKIDYLEVIYMKIPSLPDYQEAGPTKELLCYCSDE